MKYIMFYKDEKIIKKMNKLDPIKVIRKKSIIIL